MKVISLFLITTIVLFALSPVNAEGGHPHHGQMAKIFENLNLDENQKADVKALMKRQREENKVIYKKLHELRNELNELEKMETLDKGRMLAIGREMGELKIKAKFQRRNFYKEFRNFLTLEQEQELDAIRKKVKEEYHQRRREKKNKKRRFESEKKGEHAHVANDDKKSLEQFKKEHPNVDIDASEWERLRKKFERKYMKENEEKKEE